MFAMLAGPDTAVLFISLKFQHLDKTEIRGNI